MLSKDTGQLFLKVERGKKPNVQVYEEERKIKVCL